jgi:hypothetical protein
LFGMVVAIARRSLGMAYAVRVLGLTAKCLELWVLIERSVINSCMANRKKVAATLGYLEPVTARVLNDHGFAQEAFCPRNPVMELGLPTAGQAFGDFFGSSRVRQLLTQVHEFIRGCFKKCHYSKVSCFGSRGFVRFKAAKMLACSVLVVDSPVLG